MKEKSVDFLLSYTMVMKNSKNKKGLDTTMSKTNPRSSPKEEEKWRD
jgi:hypothetical protein